MVDHVPDRQGHDRRYSLDITKIREELGYVPRVRFERGLEATVDWYRANRSWWEPLKKSASEMPAVPSWSRTPRHRARPAVRPLDESTEA
jgi:dTDP-D-glucose 4,6-dehydratase